MIIPETKAQKALEIIMHLEDYDTLDTFIENITLVIHMKAPAFKIMQGLS